VEAGLDVELVHVPGLVADNAEVAAARHVNALS
jgi:hypothetical protein